MTATQKEQAGGDSWPLLLDEELAGRVAWMIRLRWFAGAAVMLSAAVATLMPRIVLPWVPLLGLAAAILIYNGVFALILRHLKNATGTTSGAYSRLASAQFITDWIALTGLVHHTGGVGSPILFFFIFHAILAAILLPPRPAWLHATAGVLFVSLLAMLEFSGVIPQRPVPGFIFVPADNPVITAGMLLFFACSIFGTFYLAGSIAKRLWARTRDLAEAGASLEAAYGQLQAMSEAKTRFFFTAAHELKSPVAAVQSSLDLLKEGYLGDLPENQRNVIERTHIRLGGLRALLADLMDMGSLGSRTAADRTAIDFGALVRRMTDVLRLDADNKGISLQVSIGSDRKIVASERHIERVVENLVGNAIKYTPDGGRVEVAVIDDGDGLVFRVADSGVGISADALPRIFDEFYRAEGVRQTHEGTGLGLALVKKICDLYGGRIDVKSEPGVGTTFTVRLRSDA